MSLVEEKISWPGLTGELRRYRSKLGSVWYAYLRSVLSASVMVLQRFSRASRRCGSSFRNLTASTSTLSTTRILLCRLGNWSAWEGQKEVRRRGNDRWGEDGWCGEKAACQRCWDNDVWKNEGGEGGRGEITGCCRISVKLLEFFCHRRRIQWRSPQ